MVSGANRRFTPGNLDVLHALLDSASAALSEARTEKPGRLQTRPLSCPGDSERAGILFTGNPHEAVPRRLLLDNRLTPLERNAWQVFRLLLNDDGLTSFPTYEQLRPYLASSPFKLASKESIAKALTALRMTRWLSLGGKVRDDVTGQMKGNIYLLHDEPVSIAEAMLLDAQYLELIGNGLGHANRSIQDLAAQVMEEMATDPYLAENTLPTHLETLQQRLAGQRWGKTRGKIVRESEPGTQPSELRETGPVRNPVKPGSESEPSPFPGSASSVRNPNSYSTSTDTYLCKTTVPPTGERLRVPEAFLELPPAQRQKAQNALNQLDGPLQQCVLDQWSQRCTSAKIRNPAGYLFGMIQKAIRGEFNALADTSKQPTSKPFNNTQALQPRPEPTLGQPHHTGKPQGRRLATGQQCMTEIWALLKSRNPDAN